MIPELPFSKAIEGPWMPVLDDKGDKTGTEYYDDLREDGVYTIGIQGMTVKSIKDWLSSLFPWSMTKIGNIWVTKGIYRKWLHIVNFTDVLNNAGVAKEIHFHNYSQGAATTVVALAWLYENRPDIFSKVKVQEVFGQHRCVWGSTKNLQKVYNKLRHFYIKNDAVTIWGWPLKLVGKSEVAELGFRFYTPKAHDWRLYQKIWG